MNDINILILSAGSRNKIVEYFKNELDGLGKIIATDCSNLAPAIYCADKHYIVPRITDCSYLEIILDICKRENIKALFSLIDPELSLIAENKDLFLSNGVIPVVSNFETVELCFDKYKMNQFLKMQGFPYIKSYSDFNQFKKAYDNSEVAFPVFVKPICGSCSMDIQKVYEMDRLSELMNENNDLMIQEFMNGKEYGVDAYIDLISGDVVSLFCKEKILMRAGETDKSVSVKITDLIDIVLKFARVLSFNGHIDIDVFEKNGEYYISEVNPRFGGGYLHAYECGVNFPKLLINNLKGVENCINIGDYKDDVYMMKYLDVCIKEGSEI